MPVKDLSVEELTHLIRETIIATLEGYLGNSDRERELTESMKQRLLDARERRQREEPDMATEDFEKLWLHDAAQNPAFADLYAPEEDIYSPRDGQPFHDPVHDSISAISLRRSIFQESQTCSLFERSYQQQQASRRFHHQ